MADSIASTSPEPSEKSCEHSNQLEERSEHDDKKDLNPIFSTLTATISKKIIQTFGGGWPEVTRICKDNGLLAVCPCSDQSEAWSFTGNLQQLLKSEEQIRSIIRAGSNVQDTINVKTLTPETSIPKSNKTGSHDVGIQTFRIFTLDKATMCSRNPNIQEVGVQCSRLRNRELVSDQDCVAKINSPNPGNYKGIKSGQNNSNKRPSSGVSGSSSSSSSKRLRVGFPSSEKFLDAQSQDGQQDLLSTWHSVVDPKTHEVRFFETREEANEAVRNLQLAEEDHQDAGCGITVNLCDKDGQPLQHINLGEVEGEEVEVFEEGVDGQDEVTSSLLTNTGYRDSPGMACYSEYQENGPETSLAQVKNEDDEGNENLDLTRYSFKSNEPIHSEGQVVDSDINSMDRETYTVQVHADQNMQINVEQNQIPLVQDFDTTRRQNISEESDSYVVQEEHPPIEEEYPTIDKKQKESEINSNENGQVVIQDEQVQVLEILDEEAGNFIVQEIKGKCFGEEESANSAENNIPETDQKQPGQVSDKEGSSGLVMEVHGIENSLESGSQREEHEEEGREGYVQLVYSTSDEGFQVVEEVQNVRVVPENDGHPVEGEGDTVVEDNETHNIRIYNSAGEEAEDIQYVIQAQEGEDGETHYILTPSGETQGDIVVVAEEVLMSPMGQNIQLQTGSEVQHVQLDQSSGNLDLLALLGEVAEQTQQSEQALLLQQNNSQMHHLEENGEISHIALMPKTEVGGEVEVTAEGHEVERGFGTNFTKGLMPPLKLSHIDRTPTTLKRTPYKRHLGKVQNEKGQWVHQCELCCFQAKKMYYMQRHMLMHERGKKLYKCKFCDYATLHSGQVAKHEIQNHSQLIYACEECNYRTNLKERMNYHARVKHKVNYNVISTEPPKIYQCPICDYKASRESFLQSHLKTHQAPSGADTGDAPGLVSVFKCSYCPYQTDVKKLFKHHLYNMHECWTCGLVCDKKKELVAHWKTHNKDDRLLCEQCGKDFENKAKLDLHTKIHSDHQSVPCDICAMPFSSQSTLALHRKKQHSDRKVFQCPYCSKNFLKEKCLYFHIEKRHEEAEHLKRADSGESVGVTILKCEFCKYRTHSQNLLFWHMRRNHREEDTVEGQSMYECHVCGWRTVMGSTFRRHLATHGIEPSEQEAATPVFQNSVSFQCSMCSFVTEDKTEYDDHMDTVHKCPKCQHVFPTFEERETHVGKCNPDKEKLWCRLCKLTFTTQEGIARHMRVKHRFKYKYGKTILKQPLAKYKALKDFPKVGKVLNDQNEHPSEVVTDTSTKNNAPTSEAREHKIQEHSVMKSPIQDENYMGRNKTKTHNDVEGHPGTALPGEAQKLIIKEETNLVPTSNVSPSPPNMASKPKSGTGMILNGKDNIQISIPKIASRISDSTQDDEHRDKQSQDEALPHKSDTCTESDKKSLETDKNLGKGDKGAEQSNKAGSPMPKIIRVGKGNNTTIMIKSVRESTDSHTTRDGVRKESLTTSKSSHALDKTEKIATDKSTKSNRIVVKTVVKAIPVIPADDGVRKESLTISKSSHAVDKTEKTATDKSTKSNRIVVKSMVKAIPVIPVEPVPDSTPPGTRTRSKSVKDKSSTTKGKLSSPKVVSQIKNDGCEKKHSNNDPKTAKQTKSEAANNVKGMPKMTSNKQIPTKNSKENTTFSTPVTEGRPKRNCKSTWARRN